MAIKKTIELDAKFDTESIDNFNKSVQESGESVNDLVGGVDDVNTELKETGDIANKSLKGIEKGSKGAKKGLGNVSTGFRAIGGAIKAAGIGLLIGLFATLKEVLESNQKVLDFFETTMNAVSLAFNAVVEVVTTAVTSVNESTDGFDALGKVMSGLLTIVLAPFKIVWDEIRLGIAGAQLLWEKSVFGSGDADKIKGLEDDIKSIAISMAETVQGVIDAGSDIVDNFGEAVSEVGELGAAVIDGVKEISVSALIDQAAAITELKKAAEIAIAVNQGLIEQNDRLAEQQRQIRDDVNRSIEDRIKANDKLNEILAKQAIDMKANADLQIAAAQAEFDRLGNQENRIALLDAQNEKLAIEAQITGFQSEQLVNQVALENELRDLTQTSIDAETQRAINRSQFNAEQIENETLRIEALQESLKLENELETERLENQIERLEEGTQAKVDAEQELLDFKEDVKQREEELIKELADTQEEADKKAKKEAQDAGDVKIDIAKSTAAVATTLIDENTKLGKAAGAANATVNTFEGISGVWTADYTPGIPLALEIAQRIAATAVVAASGFAAVKSINSTSLSGGGGGSFSGGGGSVPQVQAPQFNVVGDTSTNQITDAINSQNQQPTRAFVVSSDVTTAQELDRNIIGQASL